MQFLTLQSSQRTTFFLEAGVLREVSGIILPPTILTALPRGAVLQGREPTLDGPAPALEVLAPALDRPAPALDGPALGLVVLLAFNIPLLELGSGSFWPTAGGNVIR